MTSYFISDCHLSPATDTLNEKFYTLLTQIKQADALYILGDFFNLWIGDDDHTATHQKIRQQFAKLTHAGLPIYIMPGNRDFLLNQKFCAQTGCQLLADPTVINLYGVDTILSHGDLLCTDDKKYQVFRKVTHSPILQSLFLSLPLTLRQKIANMVKSTTQHTRVDADANLDAIKQLCRKYQCQQIIHGHTHKPSIEFHYHDQPALKRIVLSDWHQSGHYLQVESNGAMKSCFF